LSFVRHLDIYSLCWTCLYGVFNLPCQFDFRTWTIWCTYSDLWTLLCSDIEFWNNSTI